MPNTSRLRGVHLAPRKGTAERPIERMPAPDEVVIAMSQHIGAPCTPLVEAGSTVRVGQKIGDTDAFVSAPVHSSVSGVVREIVPIVTARNTKTDAVVIETDHRQTMAEDLRPPSIESRADLIAAARECGLVGLGGAGFPTHVKLSPRDPAAIDVLVVNGAECEPYVTSDYRMMMEHGDAVIEGIGLVLRHLEIPEAVIGIKADKPEAIRHLRELAAASSFSVRVETAPSIYPIGAEKLLIHHLTGRVVPEGKIPADVGVIELNVTTLAELARYSRTGIPLVDRVVTVAGSCAGEPKNVRLPIGTRVEDAVSFCGGYAKEPAEIVIGGPNMGISCPDDRRALVKMDNTILLLDGREIGREPETACIRCGRCVRNCPMRLNPTEMDRAYHANDREALKALKVNLCMECGVCAYVCPAKRDLVAYNRLGKALIR